MEYLVPVDNIHDTTPAPNILEEGTESLYELER